jgi:hypothetical protein
MRLDENAIGLSLTEAQHYFVSCWHNVIHEQSLDSHRIKTMNPRNILRELIRIVSAPHANDADRDMVRKEAELILKGDRVLQLPPLAAAVEKLLYQLKKTGEKFGQSGLGVHLAREVLEHVDTDYVRVALEHLDGLVKSGVSVPDKEAIYQATGSLLSTLVDTGASLESLYQLYRNILVPWKRSGYQFNRKYGLLKTLVLKAPTEHKVLFAIDGVTNETDFPSKMGDVAFFNEVKTWSLNSDPLRAYATPQSRRLFAEVTVTARDVRVAGTEAYEKIGNILDLTRFEYERERVQLSTEFLVQETGRLVGKKLVRRFSIPKMVPNPVVGIGTQELSLFVSSVNQLLSSARFQQEDRDRVLSAFRLYRQGADATSFDSKLVTWWSAIEYLIRGKGQKQIGTVVENGLTPLLCLIYGEKLLLDVRHTLTQARAQVVDPTTNTPLPYRNMEIRDLRRLFSRSDISILVSDAVKSDPFVRERVQRVLSVLSSAPTYLAMLKEHEQRVRWQIQRLWRARCDIVHSARLHFSGVLLCANLESYLKVILTALLAELRQVKTLCSPEEFFERQEFIYARLRENLQAGSLDALDSSLELSSSR